MSKPPIVRDVSQLPTYGSGSGNPLWWGNFAFMVIEGLAFVFAIATYFYLYNHNQYWPLGPQPGLLWSSLLAALLLLSEIPNIWLKKAATKNDLGRVRLGLVIMSLIGIGAVVLRCFEFTTLNVRWDDNAYASILWFLLGLHTTHLITDLAETIIMTVLNFIGPVDRRRFPEVEDNQDYWHFIVVTWLIVYTMLYWAPRWLETLA